MDGVDDLILGERDTIAAVATPSGAGGVGIVRVSGPQAVSILGALLSRSADALPDRVMLHGCVRDVNGARLDDVLAVAMRAPRSYTGEDVAEIHGHGGSVNMKRLLRAVLAAGARPAEPGEFTRRAFETGRMDLARAEAVVDVINASSERAWRLAQAQLAGALGARVADLRERATALLAEVEACIDFPEEGESYLGDAGIADRASALREEVAALVASFALGRALRDGISVALTGPVNTGKSSIFNQLIGKERALVDATPGTTRDFVEAEVVWDGIAVTLIDTAGEREADNQVEQRGIELGRRRAAEADLCLVVRPVDEAGPAECSPRELLVLSKGDLAPEVAPEGVIVTSAVTGRGFETLKAHVLERVCGAAADSDDGHIVTSERQRALLSSASEALSRAVAAIAAGAPTEIAALEIRDAVQHLASMTGERVGDDVLDVLFARFCIGK